MEETTSSILNSIKKLLGLPKEYVEFDADIIMHINSAFFTLYQIGVCSDTMFRITDENDLWSDFIEDSNYASAIIDYVYLKVRIIFDPPTNASLLESMKQQIAEYEWRLRLQTETEGGEKNV